MRNVLLHSITIIFFLMSCCSCVSHSNSTNQTNDPARYDSITILYPMTDAIWKSLRCFSIVQPEDFTKECGYKGSLRAMKVSDTTFIDSLKRRLDKVDNQLVKDGLDTWVMVLLSNKKGDKVDSLALSDDFICFNGDFGRDSCLTRMIYDKIISHDKDWADLVSDYYVNGEWYPLGLQFHEEFSAL